MGLIGVSGACDHRLLPSSFVLRQQQLSLLVLPVPGTVRRQVTGVALQAAPAAVALFDFHPGAAS